MYEAPHGKARKHSCDPQRISNLRSRANALGDRKMAGQNFEGDGWQLSGEYKRGTFLGDIYIFSSHRVSDVRKSFIVNLRLSVSHARTRRPQLYQPRVTY